MDVFKAPLYIPQDLLLIHDIVGVPVPAPSPQVSRTDGNTMNDGDTGSSDSDVPSEDEIQAELAAVQAEDGEGDQPMSSSDSDSDLDSKSDTESDININRRDKGSDDEEHSDDEDSGHAPTKGTYFQTKNEFLEGEILVPDVQNVGPEEHLEKVGEIMSVVGNLAIVKGVSSDVANRGAKRALDSNTLLVFEDRSVMGHIYETFGPTCQPLYQIKFNKAFPLDPERIKPSREVFHVPERSIFVFLDQIRHVKGSDASNVHDEEPAEYELDFSDDEAEAAFKNRLKRRRAESRGHSVTSSRQASPTPSRMYDQDMNDETLFSRNPYDEHGPYDLGFSAGPSRPPPIPYDDPYTDNYGSTISQLSTSTARGERLNKIQCKDKKDSASRRRDNRGRGMGRGRGRECRDHGRRSYRRSEVSSSNEGSNLGESSWSSQVSAHRPSYEPRISRPLSPTSFTIARSTGQLPDGSRYIPQQSFPAGEHWVYPASDFVRSQPFSFGPANGYPQPLVQPHINPRFAAAFAMGMGIPQPQLVQPSHCQSQNDLLQSVNRDVASGSNWTDEWIVPTNT